MNKLKWKRRDEMLIALKLIKICRIGSESSYESNEDVFIVQLSVWFNVCRCRSEKLN